MIFTRFFVEKMMWIRRLVRVCAICPSGLRFPIIPFHPFRVGLGIFPSRGLHPRLFHPTPSGWTSLRDSRPGGCTPGYSIPPLRGGPHFAIPVPGVAPPAIPSHPFGVDLTSRFPYRGFAPPAIPSHPFGVDLTSRFPYRGLCTPGYSIPPLRGGPHFAIPVPGVVHPRLFHPTPSRWTSLRDSRTGGLHPRLFHPTPSGWTSLRDSRPGGCAPPAIPAHLFGMDLTSLF